MPSEKNQQTLEPGATFDCPQCSVHSKIELYNSMLECSTCKFEIGTYDTVDSDRVSYDENGSLNGRGDAFGKYSQVSGTRMEKGKGLSSRLIRIQNNLAAADGPSKPKVRSIKLIKTHSTTKAQERIALELLNIGWPNDLASSNISRPIWQPAHPYGVESSAATCLHLASIELGVDSKFIGWLDKSLPSVPSGNRNSYGFRALKEMKLILNNNSSYTNTLNRDNWQAVLSRANLGQTNYGILQPQIVLTWNKLQDSDYNLVNHSRHVLAAITHIVAKQNGIRPCRDEIMSLFSVKQSYLSWIPKVKFLLCLE